MFLIMGIAGFVSSTVFPLVNAPVLGTLGSPLACWTLGCDESTTPLNLGTQAVNISLNPKRQTPNPKS